VAAHHGSLAREIRLDAEQQLKRGELKVLVATASLELGIDIGDVDLVCQVGTTRTIAAFLQRVGRSGHAVGGLPKGRLFPLTRDDLCDAAALLDAVRRGELDRVAIPAQSLDVLAQQIVSEVAQQEWREDALFTCFRRAHPFRDLARREFDAVVRMLAEGFDSSRGRRSAHLHRDVVNGVLRGRRGAALTAVTSAGTIPDTADYAVVLEPQATVVGSVNEDFAIESLTGDVFQLGNTSYRILRVERGTVRVEDAKGAPPGIPFWFGEAPARSAELCASLSRLRATIEARLAGAPARVEGEGQSGASVIEKQSTLAWLTVDLGLAPCAAEQIVDYYASALAALGALPTVDRVILERFFDEAGGMQLVIHAPFGSRVNRAWGLALRKRFCRKFNFELQAAATEDAIVLSLSSSHSFPLAEVAGYLSPTTVRPLLVQALLDAPMFASRWRWNATVALALPRFRGGRKVAPQLQRMNAEDLLAHVFPDQAACGENLVGDREIPDHPLVRQTIDDCLHEAMDIAGVEHLLARMARGEVRVVARDLVEPSPLALEVLSARPYAYLDDAPLEERRTQAVLARRWLDADTASDLGQLDAAAIDRVRTEAWPDPRDADELADAMATLAFVAEDEMPAAWLALAHALAAAGRATRFDLGRRALWVAAERLPELEALIPQAVRMPEIDAPPAYRKVWDRSAALVDIVRDRLQALGPVTAAALAAPLGLARTECDATLAALESEGTVMRGRFTPGATDLEWCERRLLARIHRYTVNRLRAEIEPVEPRDFMRFLFRWQRVAADTRVEGADALAAIVSQLEGYEAPAAAWEREILPARVNEYDPAWLDELSLAGRSVWTRLAPPRGTSERNRSPVRTTPIVLLGRRNLALWTSLGATDDAPVPSPRAAEIGAFIREHGASFFE
jgi:ATP-dependent Lhr-like helicase